LGEASIPALAESAASRISTTRQTAVKALSKISSSKVADPLAARLADDMPEIRRAAAQSLQAIGWTPRGVEQSSRFAIEIRDWETAAQGGSMVVPLLMDIIKAKNDYADSWEGAESALAAVSDPAAVSFLTDLCHDPDLAGAALRSLENILCNAGHNLPDASLVAILELPGLVQNQFEFDGNSSTFQVVGFEPLDQSRLVHYASQELERRKTTLAVAG
jgi:HEAT repeat protein